MVVSGTVESAQRDDDPGPLDVCDDISFDLEEINEVLAELIDLLAERKPKTRALLRARLGVSGAAPETLAKLATHYDISRDRVRQLHTRAVGELIRLAQQVGHPGTAAFRARYPVEARDRQLVRALLVETYVTDADIAATELAHLKLRLAGHHPEDAKRIAGFVSQRIAAWQKKTNRRLAKLVEDEAEGTHDFAPWAACAHWPSATSPAPLPTASARTVDDDDDGRGRFYLDKVGRDVPFDSGLEARLLRTLNAAEQVVEFQEHPAAVEYTVDGEPHLGYPSIVAQLDDGRAVLIDVQPLGHVGFHTNRIRSAAAERYAHDRGWGWLIWTGSTLGVADLIAREVDATLEHTLREQLTHGPMSRQQLRELRGGTGMDLLDFLSMVLRNEWRWDRGPFRLSAPPSPRR